MRWKLYGFNAWTEYEQRSDQTGFSITGTWGYETGLTLGFYVLRDLSPRPIVVEWDAEEAEGLRGYSYYESVEWPWDWLSRAPSFKILQPLQLALDLDELRTETMAIAQRAVATLAAVDLSADPVANSRMLEKLVEEWGSA